MQPQSEQKVVLPKRSTRELGKFKRCQERKFVTNFYKVKIAESLNKVYVYEAKFPPNLPADSSQIVAKSIYQLMGELKNSLGFICFTGKVIYGSKEVTIPLAYQTKVCDIPLQVAVKLTKQLSVMELIRDPKTRPSIFHFLNSKLKSCLRNSNICQIGKVGQFFKKDQLVKGFKKEMQEQYYNLQRAGLNVLRGYRFTLAMVNNQLKLQLDVCSRVLQRDNLLEQFLNFVGSREQLQAHFKDATVITRYGNYKTYKIQQVDFSVGPSSSFQCKGQKITYQQYFKKCYNADIENVKQPLLKVISQVKKQIAKNQKMNVEQEYVYLVPELVSLTGMKDEQRANFQSMKALAPFTKLSPNDRFDESYKILSTLNEAKNILEIGGQEKMDGYVMPPPTVRFRQIANLRNGAIANRGELFQPHYFKNWMFVYSKYSQQDYHEADSAMNYLRQAAQAYAIKFEEPTYIEVHGSQQITPYDFCDEIKKAVKDSKNGGFELIFIILKPKQLKFYGLIKNSLTNQLSIPCQVVQSKSLSKGKSILSVASKIAIQMSCKAGDAPWVIENNLPYFKGRNFAYSSISSSKGKGGFTISFVGTTNNACTDVYCNYIVRVNKKDKIEGVHLKKWFLNWVKSYYMKNKQLPSTLLIYRESVGDSMIKHVLEHELEYLKLAIEDVKKKAKKPDYTPEIIYIVVNKRINSRFFDFHKSQLFNPEPGSIVVEEMSVDDRFDFHLVAQKVTQGTSTPTHYIVAYDSSRIPQEDLVRFTYEQCYNYYNWQGSVKVPSCLQYANKLSKLAGESIQKPFVDSKLSDSLYFL